MNRSFACGLHKTAICSGRQQRTRLTLADNIESEKLAAAQQPDVDFLDEFSYSFLSLNRGFLDNQINGRFPDNRQWLQTIHSGQSKASLLDCPLS
jgi:hypothetical protein